MSLDQMEVRIYYSCIGPTFKQHYKFQEGF